jgi:PAS domain S-box-containing protein
MTDIASQAVGLSFNAPELAFGTLQDSLRETVLDLLPVAVYVCDSDGRILLFNRHAAELWGREPKINDDAERYCGSHRMFRLDGGPMPHDECPMADVLKTGVPIRNQEVVIERDDGLRAVALVNISPMSDASGRIVGAVNCFQDITARMKQGNGGANAARPEQQHLEEVRQRLAAVVESSSDAIVSKNLDGIIASWNKGAERIFGYTASEVIGKSILILIPPEKHAEEAEILSKLRRGERIEHY